MARSLRPPIQSGPVTTVASESQLRRKYNLKPHFPKKVAGIGSVNRPPTVKELLVLTINYTTRLRSVGVFLCVQRHNSMK